MKLKRVTVQELREIYKNNKGAPCKRYLEISHYCNVPLIVKKRQKTILTLSWFLKDTEDDFELIYKASTNDYCNLNKYEEGESYISDIYVFDEQIHEIYKGNLNFKR